MNDFTINENKKCNEFLFAGKPWSHLEWPYCESGRKSYPKGM